MGLMDMISGEKKPEDRTDQTAAGGETRLEGEQKEESSGSFMDKVSGMAGGGKQGEKDEDALDKAVDFVQEKVLGQGTQDNESAAEQAKDEAISDYIRDQYKERTGGDFPVADKGKKYGV